MFMLFSRVQNTRLMQQLKGQHHNEETLVVKPQGANGDWVHVEHPLHMVWECVYLSVSCLCPERPHGMECF